MKFKGFKFGKSKDKVEEKPAGAKASDNVAAAAAAAEPKPAGPADVIIPELTADDPPPRPHGPLGELSVEPDAVAGGAVLDDDVDISGIVEDGDAGVNLKEVGSAEPAPVPPEPKAPEVKPADAGDSFSSLFSQEEEEENPLANLIASLPDISAGELLDDLNEIQGIMREGRK